MEYQIKRGDMPQLRDLPVILLSFVFFNSFELNFIFQVIRLKGRASRHSGPMHLPQLVLSMTLELEKENNEELIELAKCSKSIENLKKLEYDVMGRIKEPNESDLKVDPMVNQVFIFSSKFN